MGLSPAVFQEGDTAADTVPGGGWGFAARYAYERDPAGFLAAHQAEHGDVFRLDGRRVVVCDPVLAHQVLAGSGETFAAGRDALNGFKVTDVQTARAWSRAHRAAWHGLGPGMLAAHARRLDRALTATLTEIGARDIEVVPQARALMCRATVDFCVSGDDGAVDNGELATAAAAASAAQLAVLDSVAPALAWLPNRVLGRSRAAEQRLRAAVSARVARRERDGPGRSDHDLLDVLLAGDHLDSADITGIVHLALLASYGLPGSALAWVIREIGLRPEVAGQIRAEAPRYADALAAGSPEAMPYTHAVVKETLRLYPPAWLMVRQVRAPIRLDRWHLPAGQEVLLTPYLIHRDPRWWPAADQFRPERWITSPGSAAPPHPRHAYLPFGSGPTMCLGHRLGSLQLVLAAARLVDSYEIQLLNPDRAQPAFDSALTPAGLRMRLTPRRR